MGARNIITSRNVNDAFYMIAENMLLNGTYSYSKNTKYLEVYPLGVTIKNPKERCLLLPKRYNSIFASIAETIWLLAGKNDICFLEYYLERAKDFSDDGYTWRGAYGPRIFNWNGINQFSNCISALRENINTTRACISIFNPQVDHDITKRDIPCNNWIQFLHRDNRLNMNVSLRANDLIWGFSGINIFAWTTLLELASNWLNISIGEYNHFVCNMVIFERHFYRIKNILDNKLVNDIYSEFDSIKKIKIDICENNFDTELKMFFDIEYKVRNNEISLYEYKALKNSISSSYLRYCLDMLTSFIYYKEQKYEEFIHLWKSIDNSDLKLCASEYILRKNNAVILKNIDSLVDDKTLSFFINNNFIHI